MSYPDPRYLGDGGEPSAARRPADAAHDVVYPSGTTVDYLATAGSTDRLFGLYRWNMAAHAGGPGPHFHRTMAESFYVLGGVVTIYDGRQWLECSAGDFVHVPAGGIHGFRNDSARTASMLIHFAPGAPREAYFEGFLRFAREGELDPAEMEEFYLAHDNIRL